MLYRIQQAIFRKLIFKERLRQIRLGYTYPHDKAAVIQNPNHLLQEAQVHFDRGHYVEALALLKANQEINTEARSRI